MYLKQALLLCMGSLTFLAACKNKALQKTKDPRLQQIHLPPGFQISIFARDIKDARSMALGDKGTVFVGNRSEDKVYALTDTNSDGVADQKYLLMEGKNMPNGVAFSKGALYVAEVNKIWRLDGIEDNLAHPPVPVPVFDSLPDKKHHGWKYIAFGPDGKLYVPIGAPCNICNDGEQDHRFATICRMNPDGTGFEVFASGIRNSVGFDWHPATKELWFTENGRDDLGEDVPPDELNKAPKPGMHFGYPYCHAGNIPDPVFGKGHSCTDYTPPMTRLAAHTAALGMKFYTGAMFPPSFRNTIFIAEHGSWNRKQPMGYRIMMARQQGDSTTSYEVFADGWLQNGKAWGRPVDILLLRDGSILVSDDFANVIYRISYVGK